MRIDKNVRDFCCNDNYIKVTSAFAIFNNYYLSTNNVTVPLFNSNALNESDRI